MRSKAGRQALLVISGIVIVGLLLLLAYAWTMGEEIFPRFGLFGFLFTIAGAAFAFGGLIGFLFAVPQALAEPTATILNTLQSNNGDSTSTQGLNAPMTKQERVRRFVANSNLIEVSDWLTKIIVGITLVNLSNLPKHIGNYAKHVTGNLSITGLESTVLTASLLYVVMGFIFVYLWGQMYLLAIFEDAQDLTEFELQTAERHFNTSLSEFSNQLSQTLAPETRPSYGNVPDDPWKEVFGGKSDHNDRSLTATVKPSGFPNFFNVDLVVKGTENNPLEREVQFFLHPTFSNERPVIKVHDNQAHLQFMAYGAFTVGALADGGNTKLELDLAKVSGAPKEFKAR